MKAHHKRIRWLRRLALAGCLAGLAVPAGANAMLPKDYPAPTPSDQQQPYTLPASFHTEVQTSAQSQQPYTLPARFHTETQTGPQPSDGLRPVVVHFQSPDHNPADKAIALRRTANPQPTSSPTPTVIRQIETVTNDGGRTLAIVLASIALAVALCSLAYATIRMTQIQRRGLGSGSH
ncbi:MAG TPA: hypothetical protein VH300_15240 [Thermoleophilaceae bacterium]|jgi:hypothetical protein|nr:hypothetical protein [Thermoleophilaceae bacterium]